MYTNVDPRVINEIPRSHDVVGRLTASVNGSSFSYPVDMEDGSVSVSGESGIRRKLTASINAHIDDPECDVYSTEIRAEYGIRTIGGDILWTPAGTFVVTDASEQDRGRVQITGEDRWRRVMDARFLRPQMTKGLHVDAIRNLLYDADSRISFVDDMGATATHRSSVWERDRDKAVMQLAKSLGGIVYFDVEGVARLSRIRGIGEDPDWIVGGGDGGVVVDVKRGRSRGNTYNAVVVEGEGSGGDVTIRSVATITSTYSKIRFGGAYASRPRYYRSSLIHTKAQADATAKALLAKVSGMGGTLTVEALPHPGLDAGDVIRVEEEPGMWSTHLVDSFTLPLGPGPITMATRSSLMDDSDMELQ